MRNRFALGLVLDPAAVLVVGATRSNAEDGPPLAHLVLSTLKDLTRQSRDGAVASCDLALHLVFEDRAEEEAYRELPRHQRFVRENWGAWSNARGFDSNLTGPGQ
jgi:hypothetical protein